MNDQKLTEQVTKALGYTENGGKPDISNTKAGKTGEMKSIFQFEPGTWDNYSRQIFGKVEPLTPDNETYVVHQKVSQWLAEDQKHGYTPEQSALRVASRWNAGVGEPDAYMGKFSDGSASSGVNKKYGVAYSVPEYTKKFKKYLDEFSGGAPDTGEVAESVPQPTVPIPQQGNLASAILPQQNVGGGSGLLAKWKPQLQQRGQVLPIPNAS